MNATPPRRLVAIHQPNFFPWLGYFDKIRRADVFVFLDAVSYPKNGWTNRVRVNVQGNAKWINCPVRRDADRICKAEIDDSKPWRAKLIKTLEANYARAPGFEKAISFLRLLIDAPHLNLAALNIAAIRSIAASLGLETRFLRQSELQYQGASNLMLTSLVRAAGGDAYLLGGGADSYHAQDVFDAAGIAVVRQNFVPVPYGPTERFIPGLSVIDYLMHDGRPLRRTEEE